MPGFDIFEISISEIQSLNISSELMIQLNDCIQSLSKVMKEAPIEYPDSLPIHRIKHKLREVGADYHDVVNADRLSLVDELLTKPLEGRVRKYIYRYISNKFSDYTKLCILIQGLPLKTS